MKQHKISIKATVTLLFIGFAFSCQIHKHEPPVYYYGTFKFKQKTDEVFFSYSFTQFLKANPLCSIVLRVPSKPNNVVEEETYSNRSMYFAIEKTLLENNFKVRDRSIFEKKFSNDSLSKSQTDLILELVSFSTVNYYTNKVMRDESKEENETMLAKYFNFKGSRAEFKITHIQTNEIVATFVLNYTPCLQGCKMKYTLEGDVEELSSDFKTRKKNGYDAIDMDENSEMFNDLAKRLVSEIRKQGYNK